MQLATGFTALQDRSLRVGYIGLLLSSIATAAVTPYQPVIAVDLLGFSETEFSTITFTSAIVSLIVALLVGMVSDSGVDRFRLIAHACMAGAIGSAMVYLFPERFSFIFSIVLLMPLAATVAQQSYAVLRARSNELSSETANAINALARLMFASSWIIMPPAVALLLWSGCEMLSIYLISGLSGVVSALLFYGASWRLRPSYKKNEAQANAVLARTTGLLASPRIQLKVVCNSVLRAVMVLHQMLIGLFLIHVVNGSSASVGIAAGITAALELPFILIWTAILRYISKASAIFLGSVLYAFYLFALPLASTEYHVYWLSPLNAIGVACLLSITISYMQDIMTDMPGLSTALNSVCGVVGAGMAAVVFAMGVGYFGYRGTAILAGTLSIIAGTGILMLERSFARVVQSE
ncbi:MFS transporter [Bordetella genomosp. 9]|uniref:MFS transporter n=1 Tax=Bordetella genomosp. 9 TaxID=1416803 RepID=UPI0012F844FF|nr:MFS transporter [Bordetella genomosp. 9]